MSETPGAERLSVADELAARRLERRRELQALRRGSARGSLLDEPKPGRSLAGGVALGVVGLIAAGIVGLVRGGPPAHWNADGNLVVDKGTGQRYVVSHGALRPIVNDTSLRLLFGGTTPTAVQVSSSTLAGARTGTPIGIVGAPYSPPPLVAGVHVIECAGPKSRAVLATTTPPTAQGSTPPTLLVNQAGRLQLVTGIHVYAVSDSTATLPALGLRTSDALNVPPAWTAGLPVGPALRPVPLARGKPIKGQPAWTKPGTLVTDAGSGALYITERRRLRPVPNRTTLRLLYAGHPPAPVRVASAAIRTREVGAPIGSPNWPDDVPAPTPLTGDSVACTVGGSVTVLPKVPTQGLDRASTRPPTTVPLWTPRGGAALITVPKAASDTTTPAAYLLSGGLAYALATPTVVSDLGYANADTVTVPARLVRQFPMGAVLTELHK